MKISLNDVGKKYYREWIFRNVDMSFVPGQKTVILGPNGSGKSTFLQVIAGAVLPTEGKLDYSNDVSKIDPDDVFAYLSFASPYLELIEEFTLHEIVKLHIKFRPMINGMNEMEVLDISGLKNNSGKVFKYFSSGMKQRVKLALAILTDSKVLMLDEPCSNLDASAIDWYKKMINTYSAKRTIIVASNENEDEYLFCDTRIFMSDIKR